MRRHLTVLGMLAALLVGGVSTTGPASKASFASDPTWSIQVSPNPAGSDNTMLAGVSCMSNGSCMAVGYSSGVHGLVTLAELRRGTKWKIEATPDVAKNNYLTGVSCSGPQWCTAVGSSITSRSVQAPLVEVWNGTSWSIQRTPSAGRGTTAGLDSVSCNRPDSCTAVGAYSKSGPNAQERPLAEHWNGSVWTIPATPNPHAENGSQLDGVSCTATDDCSAGGNYAYADVAQSVFALRWDGTRWSMEKQPNPAGQSDNTDNSVACTGSAKCVSVGSWINGGGVEETLGESWNGTSWVRDHSANPSGSVATALDGVACISESYCIAVGGWSPSSVPAFTLSETWSGSAWTLLTTPNPSGAQISSLYGVDCAADGECVAVGSYWNGTITQNLVETYS